MNRPVEERAVKVVPIPADVYDVIAEYASDNGFTCMGVICRALHDYIDAHIERKPQAKAQRTEDNA